MKIKVLKIIPENVLLILKKISRYLAKNVKYLFDVNFNEFEKKRREILKLPNNHLLDNKILTL